MKASGIQIIGLLVAITSASMLAYVNFLRPRLMPSNPVNQQTSEVNGEPLRSVASGRPAFPEEVAAGLALVEVRYGTRAVVSGVPTVLPLAAPDSGQLVLEYGAARDGVPVWGVEVVDLMANPPISIFHREGQDFQYFPVAVGEKDGNRVYLVVEERTGAGGDYLGFSVLEYDGFGTALELFAKNDLYRSILYPLPDKLLLDWNHAYYKVVQTSTGLALAPYDVSGRLSANVLRFANGATGWDLRYNDKPLVPGARLHLERGDQVFLVRDGWSDGPAVSTRIEGNGIQYVPGPPVRISAAGEGVGALVLESTIEGIPDLIVPVEVHAASP